MRVAGISVAMVSRQRPTAYLVVLDDSSGREVIEANQAFPADDVDLATQLHDTAEAVRSRLEGLAIERVVVRRADRPPSASNTEGPRIRLLMEGAVTSAARSAVMNTMLGTGADTGTWFGARKADVDAASAQLLSQHGLHSRYTEATSAALAAVRRS
jgi:hypothetical protein